MLYAERLFWKISQNLQESTCARVSFLMKLQAFLCWSLFLLNLQARSVCLSLFCSLALSPSLTLSHLLSISLTLSHTQKQQKHTNLICNSMEHLCCDYNNHTTEHGNNQTWEANESFLWAFRKVNGNWHKNIVGFLQWNEEYHWRKVKVRNQEKFQKSTTFSVAVRDLNTVNDLSKVFKR